jgi:hypothetical protein
MARKENKFHYIYKITNIKNGKYYIGMHSTDSLEDNYMGSGKRIRNSIRKHGIETHTKEILEFLNNREELAKREKEIVNESLLQDSLCMNLKYGGEGGGKIYSLDHMRKFSDSGNKALKEKMRDEEYRKNFIKLTEESRRKAKEKRIEMINSGEISANTFGGKKHKKESILLIQDKMRGKGKGDKNSQFNTCWIHNEGEKINKKIKKEEIEEYLLRGWQKGLKMIYFKK